MKKLKIMKKDFLRPRKMREIVLVLAVICLLGFVWVGYLYQQSNRKLDTIQEAVDKQITLTNNLYANAVQLAYGDLAQIAKVSSFNQQFNILLNEVKNKTEGQLTDAGMLQRVNNALRPISSSLATINKNKVTLTTIKDSTAKLSTTATDIRSTAKLLSESLSNHNGVTDLKDQLDNLIVGMDGLSNLLSSVALSDNADTAAANLAGHSILFSQLAKGMEDELNFQGNAAFDSDKQKETGELIKLLGSIPTELTALSSHIPSYVQATQSSADLAKQTQSLLGVLQGLKNSYSNAQIYPINFIPLGYFPLLIGLLFLGGVLLFLWALMVIQDSNRIRNEAITLHAEAEGQNRSVEEQSQRDQAAILRLMDELAILSDGDLTVQMEVTEDFTGAIADSINFSIESMRDMVGTITLTSEEVLKATENTQSTAKLLADSSRQQSEEINRSNTTVDRISISLGDIAQHSDSSAEIAQSSVNIAHDGRERVKRTVKSMWDIRDNIKDTSKRIKRLGESSQEIGDIVEIIKGIADQTNILALNAAIQATSAGEAGKGFAVVADEVQRLAERSGEATKQIESLVKTIQADANEAVASMESSTTQVVHGTVIAEEAGEALDKIEQVSHNLSNLIINVSDGTRQAANMARDVAKNMDNLAALNEESVQNVSSSVQSVDMLSELSVLLKESVAGFKLPEVR